MTARADACAAAPTPRPTGAIFQDERPASTRCSRTAGRATSATPSPSSSARRSTPARTRAPTPAAAAARSRASPSIPKLLGGLLDGQDAKLSGTNALNAKGGANANNTFNGVITVTVTDVMPNGNLLVTGEKQIGINQGTEFIRFSGVVNPRTVSGANTVPSTLVADARIEYTAKGYIDEAQHMGWLQRFFLNVMPF